MKCNLGLWKEWSDERGLSMTEKRASVKVIEKNVVDKNSCFRKVQLGDEIYCITSIFAGEQELKDILHRIAVRKIEKTN